MVDVEGGAFVARVSKKFAISRQAASRHVNRLVEENILEAVGQTKGRKYRLHNTILHKQTIKLSPELEEDRVWFQVVASLVDSYPQNVYQICYYGFTEMVNNVIDHSKAAELTLTITANAKCIDLEIEDDGVGIYRKIKQAMNLPDERHAAMELAKGKCTTDQERHTGQGIFFTSRVFDQYEIYSHQLVFRHQLEPELWTIESGENEIGGTRVRMRLNLSTKRTTKDVFDRFASEDDNYEFTKTTVPLSLAKFGKESLVSRSQAKRILIRLEEFNEVDLDFEGVEFVGQAFADEIFRVYRRNNPEVQLSYVNACDQVEKMVRRAMSGGN